MITKKHTQYTKNTSVNLRKEVMSTKKLGMLLNNISCIVLILRFLNRKILGCVGASTLDYLATKPPLERYSHCGISIGLRQ